MSSVNCIMTSILILVLSAATGVTVTATDHIVGANRGWNPGINYTIWTRNHTFYVGDFISFRYQKTQYNVFQVNETGYDNCTTQGATGNWTSGKDFILLTDPKRYYFICGNGQCFSGMKVTVLVHSLLPPPSIPLDQSSSSFPVPAAPAYLACYCLLSIVAFFLFS
ncbi:unnamed protein product [Rhodiola kirilowii]